MKSIHPYLFVEPCLEAMQYYQSIFGGEIKDNVKITIEFDTEDEIRKVYDSLKKDGQAILELQKTFWGALHANVTDKYGIGWILNCQLPSSS